MKTRQANREALGILTTEEPKPERTGEEKTDLAAVVELMKQMLEIIGKMVDGS